MWIRNTESKAVQLREYLNMLFSQANFMAFDKLIFAGHVTSQEEKTLFFRLANYLHSFFRLKWLELYTGKTVLIFPSKMARIIYWKNSLNFWGALGTYSLPCISIVFF